jgi:hypothetical protein
LTAPASPAAFALAARRGTADYAPGYHAAFVLDPDGNDVEALYRGVGNVGHGASPALR